MSMFDRVFFAFLVLAGASFIIGGCASDGRRQGVQSGPVEPAMDGEWTGTIQANGVTAPFALDLRQDKIAVTGAYTGPADGRFAGAKGRVSGMTTGASFLMTLAPDEEGCDAEIEASGLNDGATLSFDVRGRDCDGDDLRGQGVLTK